MKSDIKYNIAAKPTLYNGINFRSRLEAKWAAFFDMIGIKYQYEPFDLDGWTPDFILLGKTNILVEVKPIYDFNISAWKELAQHHLKHEGETMLLGNFIKRSGAWDLYTSGWLMEKNIEGENYYNNIGNDYDGYHDVFYFGWSNLTKSVDIFHAFYSYQYRLSGEYQGDGHIITTDKQYNLDKEFKAAANKVQFQY